MTALEAVADKAPASRFGRIAEQLGFGARRRQSKIFLSYRRDNSRADTHSIYQRLLARFSKDQVFMDVDSIRVGDFRDALAKNLEQCGVLVAVIGATWLDARDSRNRRRLDDPDDFVRAEIAHALDRDILVIPVLIDRTAMPTADRLPVDIEKLAYCQASLLRHESFTQDLDVLVGKIAEVVSPRRFPPWAVGGLAGLAIALAATAPWWLPATETWLGVGPGRESAALADNVRQFTSHYTLAEYVDSLRVGLKVIDDELAAEKDAAMREKLQQRRASLIEKISDPTSGYYAAARSAAQTMSLVGSLDADRGQQKTVIEQLAKNDTAGAEELLLKQLAEAQKTVEAAAEKSFALAELKELNDLDLVAAEPYYAAAAGYAPDNPKYLRAAAHAKAVLGKYAEAERYLAHTVELAANLTGPERRRLATALAALARLHWTTGAFDKSAGEFAAALAVVQELKLDKTPLEAEILDERGILLWKQGRYGDAERDLRLAVDYTAVARGEEEQQAHASALNSLASVLTETGDYAEASTLFAKALDLEKRLATGHAIQPRIANALNNIATLRRKQGQLGLAFSINREALDMYKALYGAASPSMATTALNQAVVLCRMNKFAEAEALATKSRTLREHYFGAENRLVAESASVLAYLRLQTGRFDEAVALAGDALVTRQRVMPYNKIYLAKALDLVGLVALKRSDIATAKTYLMRAYAAAKDEPGADKIVTPIILAHISELLAQSDDPALAKEVSDRLMTLASLDIDCAR